MLRVVFSVALLAVAACSPTVYTHGVPNLVQVGPNVWRSGQPKPEGWAYLRGLGITEDVKLNDEAEGSDAPAVATGIHVNTLTIVPEDDHPISTVEEPDGTKIEAAVSIMAVAAPGHGVLVHCTHGQDRTGLVVGRYREKHDKWKKSRAWKEMVANHFHPELIGLVVWWLDH